MQQEHAPTKPINDSETPWSEAEIRRVARVFDLLIRIDKRLTKGKSNEETISKTSKTKHEH